MIPWERMTSKERLQVLDREREKVLYDLNRDIPYERNRYQQQDNRNYHPRQDSNSYYSPNPPPPELPEEISEISIVNSIDEAINKLPDYNGKIKMFVNLEGAEIYTNEVNKKTGAKDFLVFRPVLTEPPAMTEMPTDNSISIVVSLAQEIDSKLSNICRELGIVKEEMKNVKSANNPISSSVIGTEVPGSSPGHSNSAQAIPIIPEQKS